MVNRWPFGWRRNYCLGRPTSLQTYKSIHLSGSPIPGITRQNDTAKHTTINTGIVAGTTPQAKPLQQKPLQQWLHLTSPN